jgi:hypothetical protein
VWWLNWTTWLAVAAVAVAVGLQRHALSRVLQPGGVHASRRAGRLWQVQVVQGMIASGPHAAACNWQQRATGCFLTGMLCCADAAAATAATVTLLGEFLQLLVVALGQGACDLQGPPPLPHGQLIPGGVAGCGVLSLHAPCNQVYPLEHTRGCEGCWEVPCGGLGQPPLGRAVLCQ